MLTKFNGEVAVTGNPDWGYVSTLNSVTQLTGLSRSAVLRLVWPDPSDRRQPPVESILICDVDQVIERRLVNLPSLYRHLDRLAALAAFEDSSVACSGFNQSVSDGGAS